MRSVSMLSAMKESSACAEIKSRRNRKNSKKTTKDRNDKNQSSGRSCRPPLVPSGSPCGGLFPRPMATAALPSPVEGLVAALTEARRLSRLVALLPFGGG